MTVTSRRPHVATSHVATSRRQVNNAEVNEWERRDVTTSRRHHVTTSPRRDVTTSRRHHVTTSPRRDVTTSRRHHVATSPRHDVTTSRRHHIATSARKSAPHHLKYEWLRNKGIGRRTNGGTGFQSRVTLTSRKCPGFVSLFIFLIFLDTRTMFSLLNIFIFSFIMF